MCREAKLLLTISAMFTFAMGLSGIFINIFFWKQTNDFKVIVTYNLIQYIVIPITFIGAGIVSKRKNGIWSLRVGMLAYALFYILILTVGNKGVSYIYILGILYGIAAGFYWLAFNTLSFDFTGINNRDTFNGLNGSCCGVTAAIAPATSGYIISKFSGIKGYTIVFTITLCMFLSLILISTLLKCKNYGNKLEFKKVILRNCDEWSDIRKATFFWGFRDVIIVFLVNILIIETTKSELTLGKLTLIASLLSSISFVLVQKIIKPPHRRVSIYIGAIGAFLAVLSLGLNITYINLLVYVMMNGFFLPFFVIQLTSATFNVINRAHEESMRVEYMINREIVLNGGRAISASMLVFMLLEFKESSVLQFYLIFIGFIAIVSGYFLGKLKNVLKGEKT